MNDIADIEKDIALVKNRIRALQNETIHCIAIKPTGKVEVVDKCHLEELNSEIDRLSGLASCNDAILARLEELTGGKTLADIRLAERRINGHVQKIRGILSADLAELLKRNPGLDVDGLATHPKAVKLQADAKAIIDSETQEMEKLTALLTQADEILAGYQDGAA